MSKQEEQPIVAENQQQERIVIKPKYYPRETYALTGSGQEDGKFFSFNSTLMMNYCDFYKLESYDMIPGADPDNPVIISRGSEQEEKIEFCVSSTDREAITWDLMARDRKNLRFLEVYQNESLGALGKGVTISFNKATLPMPAWNMAVRDNLPPNSDRFTVFISANKTTLLGESFFEVVAIRHLDDNNQRVQVIAQNVAVRVID